MASTSSGEWGRKTMVDRALTGLYGAKILSTGRNRVY